MSEEIIDLKDQMDHHLIKNDSLLRAALDMAEAGRAEMEEGVYDRGDRFCAIRELLEIYRGRNEGFIKSLFPGEAA